MRRCECSSGWSGSACDAPAACPAGCSGNGRCNAANGTCVCDPGFEGDACQRRTECPAGCEQHGECRDDNFCECHPDWAGDACEIKLTCDGDCSGHGRCADGVCICDDLYEGADCATTYDPKTKRPPPKPKVQSYLVEQTSKHTRGRLRHAELKGGRDGAALLPAA